MKKIISLLALLFCSNAFASGGFTWMSALSHATGLDEVLHHAFPGVHHTEHIVTFSFVGILFIIITLLYRLKVKSVEAAVVPDKGVTFRNIVEMYGTFIYGQAKAVLGEKSAPKYYTFVASLFIIIFISNAIGLVPGFLPPTESINTTLALGVLSFVYFNLKGCKELGTLNYIKHFAGPLWHLAILIFPIEIISTCIRPISLALRLYGNMFGDHMVLGTFSNLAPYVVPVVFLFLGLLVCFIQAYVFTMLSMVYISLATAHHDHDEHHAHH